MQIAYAIGVAEPISVLVDTHATGSVADERLEAAVRSVFDLTPRGIIEALALRRPIYRQTAAYALGAASFRGSRAMRWNV